MAAWSTPTARIGCCIALGWRCASDAKRGPALISHNAKRKQNRLAHRLDPPGVQPEPIATTYWERLDQKLQWVLEGGPVYWQQPSDPQRLRLFCRTLEELRSQCEMEGLKP